MLIKIVVIFLVVMAVMAVMFKMRFGTKNTMCRKCRRPKWGCLCGRK